MTWVSDRVRNKVVRHVMRGKPLSTLRLPFDVVLATICRTGVGAIGEGGTYALVFAPAFVRRARVAARNGNEAVRYAPDPDWRAWLERNGICTDTVGDIATVRDRMLGHVKQIEFARFGFCGERLHGWRDD